MFARFFFFNLINFNFKKKNKFEFLIKKNISFFFSLLIILLITLYFFLQKFDFGLIVEWFFKKNEIEITEDLDIKKKISNLKFYIEIFFLFLILISLLFIYLFISFKNKKQKFWIKYFPLFCFVFIGLILIISKILIQNFIYYYLENIKNSENYKSFISFFEKNFYDVFLEKEERIKNIIIEIEKKELDIENAYIFLKKKIYELENFLKEENLLKKELTKIIEDLKEEIGKLYYKNFDLFKKKLELNNFDEKIKEYILIMKKKLSKIAIQNIFYVKELFLEKLKFIDQIFDWDNIILNIRYFFSLLKDIFIYIFIIIFWTFNKEYRKNVFKKIKKSKKLFLIICFFIFIFFLYIGWDVFFPFSKKINIFKNFNNENIGNIKDSNNEIIINRYLKNKNKIVFWFTFLSIIILAPLWEEIFFRYFVILLTGGKNLFYFLIISIFWFTIVHLSGQEILDFIKSIRNMFLKEKYDKNIIDIVFSYLSMASYFSLLFFFTNGNLIYNHFSHFSYNSFVFIKNGYIRYFPFL